MTHNPTTPAPATEEWMTEVVKCFFPAASEEYLKTLVEFLARRYAAAHPEGADEATWWKLKHDQSEQITSLTTALAEAKARCAELTEKLTDTMDARNVAWLDLAHMKARAESAEAQRDRMKVALESVEVLEEYSGKAGRRQYGKLANVWLYPGDAIATISIRKLSAALSTPPAEEKP